MTGLFEFVSYTLLVPYSKRHQAQHWWRNGWMAGSLLLILSLVILINDWGRGFCSDTGTVGALIVMVGWAMIILSPVITATGAAWITARSRRPERYDLYYLTPLSNQVLVWAHAGLVWRGLRHLFALLLALSVFLPVYTTDFTLRDTYGNWWCRFDRSLSFSREVMLPVFWLYIFVVGFWGAQMVGIVIGVWMGLFRRHTHWAVANALFGIIVFMAALPTLIGCSIWTAPWFWEIQTLTSGTVLLLVWMAIPYGVAQMVLHQVAVRWRRE